MEVNVILRGTPDEVRAAMRELLNDPIPAAVPAREAGPDVAVEPEIVPPARRGRRPKATETTQPVTDIDEKGNEVKTDTPPETEATEVSEAYLVAAIKAFMKAKGENETWALFTKYGAKNRSTLMASGKAPEAVAEIEAAVGVDAIKAEMAT